MDEPTTEGTSDPDATGPVDQQAAALQADPAPPGTGAPGGAAEEAGIVDQQDAALAAMDRADGTPDTGSTSGD
jgi:hypothetical protein